MVNPTWKLHYSFLMEILELFYRSIHELGRCCLHCGSFFAGASQFCSECEKHLWQMHPQLRVSQIGKFKVNVMSLFDWYPDQDRKVSKLIMVLKGGSLKQAYQFYTQIFVSRLYGDLLPENCVFVPCPSQDGRYHSQVLAHEFSKTLGAPVRDVLKKHQTQGKQKHRTLGERYFVEMTSDENLDGKYVIFIDDIVTTGATALSARKALGSIQGFEVWCLAHRCQLAANTSF